MNKTKEYPFILEQKMFKEKNWYIFLPNCF